LGQEMSNTHLDFVIYTAAFTNDWDYEAVCHMYEGAQNKPPKVLRVLGKNPKLRLITVFGPRSVFYRMETIIRNRHGIEIEDRQIVEVNR
jgi:hypothetical protein